MYPGQSLGARSIVPGQVAHVHERHGDIVEYCMELVAEVVAAAGVGARGQDVGPEHGQRVPAAALGGAARAWRAVVWRSVAIVCLQREHLSNRRWRVQTYCL